MADHRSIDEVLDALHQEFPDVTVSKIRFLESQGLLSPARTSSGNRRFGDADVGRLRWILTHQRDTPDTLAEIKARLDSDAGPSDSELAASWSAASPARDLGGEFVSEELRGLNFDDLDDDEDVVVVFEAEAEEDTGAHPLVRVTTPTEVVEKAGTVDPAPPISAPTPVAQQAGPEEETSVAETKEQKGSSMASGPQASSKAATSKPATSKPAESAGGTPASRSAPRKEQKKGSDSSPAADQGSTGKGDGEKGSGDMGSGGRASGDRAAASKSSRQNAELTLPKPRGNARQRRKAARKARFEREAAEAKAAEVAKKAEQTGQDKAAQETAGQDTAGMAPPDGAGKPAGARAGDKASESADSDAPKESKVVKGARVESKVPAAAEAGSKGSKAESKAPPSKARESVAESTNPKDEPKVPEETGARNGDAGDANGATDEASNKPKSAGPEVEPDEAEARPVPANRAASAKRGGAPKPGASSDRVRPGTQGDSVIDLREEATEAGSSGRQQQDSGPKRPVPAGAAAVSPASDSQGRPVLEVVESPRATVPALPDFAMNDFDISPTSVSLTRDELMVAAQLTEAQVADLEKFGMISGRSVGATVFYDDDALTIARVAARFASHGIEARHLRSYKVAAEREAGLFEQAVMPLVRRPDGGEAGRNKLAELGALGEAMRGASLRQALRPYLQKD